MFLASLKKDKTTFASNFIAKWSFPEHQVYDIKQSCYSIICKMYLVMEEFWKWEVCRHLIGMEKQWPEYQKLR
jgi:hypothetical protein